MRKRIVAFLGLSVMLFVFSANAHSRETHEKPINVVRTYITTASWYKHGKLTANGERFNPYGLTVAHRTLPFGTKLRLTNPQTQKTIIATVNDRGPYIRGRNLDVSLGCAYRLGMYDKGVIRLKVEVLE